MPDLFPSLPPVADGPFGSVPPGRSTIEPGIIAAYRRTRYEVRAGSGIDLYVDQPSQWLAALLVQHQAMTAGVVTAWNPFSKPFSTWQNRERQARLLHRLADAGAVTLPVFGHDPDGHWPGEEMLLVIDLAPKTLMHLASHFQQNAILFADAADATPQLLLLR